MRGSNKSVRVISRGSVQEVTLHLFFVYFHRAILHSMGAHNFYEKSLMKKKLKRKVFFVFVCFLFIISIEKL